MPQFTYIFTTITLSLEEDLVLRHNLMPRMQINSKNSNRVRFKIYNTEKCAMWKKAAQRHFINKSLVTEQIP